MIGPAFAAVLVLATTSGFFALFAVSVLSPFIIAEMELSRTAYGSVSAVIYLSASLFSLVAGRVTERLPSRGVLYLLFAAAIVAWGLIAAAGSFSLLLVGAVMAGFPLALALPITTGLVRSQVPAGRRGAYLGIAQSGSQVGALLAGVSLPLLALRLGWRGALASMGAVAIVGAVAASRTRLSNQLVPKTASYPAAGRAVVTWLALYGFGMNAGVTIVSAYLPIFAFEALQFSARRAGATLVVIAVISFASKVLWGGIADAAPRLRLPLGVLAVSAVVAALLLAVTTPARGWVLWVAVALFGVGGVTWAVVTMTAVARLLPLNEVGRAAGTVMLASFFGAALAPIGFGSLADSALGYRGAWILTAGLFGLATIVMVAWYPGRADNDRDLHINR